MNRNIVATIASYLGVGLASVAVAVYLASQFVASGRAQEPAPGQESSDPAQGASQEPSQTELAAEVQSFLEPFIYDPKGRRDPFRPYVEMSPAEEGDFQGPLLPLQRFDLDQLKLIGIIWEVKDPKAMFLDPNSQVHVLGRDERIGRNNGYIAVIREGEVVVVEATRSRGEAVYSTRVLRIAR